MAEFLTIDGSRNQAMGGLFDVARESDIKLAVEVGQGGKYPD